MNGPLRPVALFVLLAMATYPLAGARTSAFHNAPSSEHGSSNKYIRAGYELIRIPLHQTGRATDEYEDFLTGFVLQDGNAWGRPVGVAVAQDGSLLVSDDGSNSIWLISYTGK
jgi:glucose/arabinose dehydrogenase